VTDANVVLARIDPSRPIGIERDSLDVEAARKALAISAPSSVLVSRNRRGDPRGGQPAHGRPHPPAVDRAWPRSARFFALVAFGGAGPVHGAALMQKSHWARCWCRRFPACSARWLCVGQTCAMICRALSRKSSRARSAAIAQIMRSSATRRSAGARSDAVTKTLTVSTAVDMAYLGRSRECALLGRSDWPVARMVQAFNEAYRARVRQCSAGFLMIINVRTTVEGVRTAAVRNRMAWRAPQSRTAHAPENLFR